MNIFIGGPKDVLLTSPSDEIIVNYVKFSGLGLALRYFPGFSLE
jgi:hypothetical protein